MDSNGRKDEWIKEMDGKRLKAMRRKLTPDGYTRLTHCSDKKYFDNCAIQNSITQYTV